MSWLLYALALVLLLDAIRMRRRIAAMGLLCASDEPVAATHRIIAAPGVTVDDATRRAASAYANAHAVDVVDIVPGNLPAIRAMTLAQLVDPAAYRTDPLGAGRTAGHAILVDAALAERAGIGEIVDEVAFVHAATRLKHYGRGDVAIAPAERAHTSDRSRRLEILRAMIGPSTTFALAALPILWLLLGIGIWLQPLPGVVALAAWQLQSLVALAATPIRSRDLPVVVVLRLPIELWLWLHTMLGSRGTDPAVACRADYARRIAAGTGPFHAPRRDTCPMCDAPDLVVHLRNADLFQHKPGRFTLERCRRCRHIFQNPQLSLAGLDYYYKDFYDGLGETGMKFVFGYSAAPYHARAKMVRDVASPRRWLDVGAGHGHFCVAARDEFPDTMFDGLDLSESIDEAKRRGWVDTAHRGLFPELAPQFAGRYDAISMSHYLEHTLDPRRELDAASTALVPGGCLLIELPDPEFTLGRVLRRYWLPWFQPQHLHLLSVATLERLLRERGFTPIAWQRGEAHQRVDFFFAAWLFLDRLAPSPQLPWRRRGATARAWRALVWTLGSPLIVAGIAIDSLAGPVFSRAKVSNTYRVVARKQPSDCPES